MRSFAVLDDVVLHTISYTSGGEITVCAESVSLLAEDYLQAYADAAPKVDDIWDALTDLGITFDRDALEDLP